MKTVEENNEIVQEQNAYVPGPYIGREESWMDFNYRVLEEAFDKTNMLMDRFKFLAITASNLDEFFSVRIAGILDQVSVGYTKKGLNGKTSKEELKILNKMTHEFMRHQYSCLNKSLIPEMEKQGIKFVEYQELNKDEKNFVDDYFLNFCLPVITPQAIDASRQFPLINSGSTYLIVQLANPEHKKKKKKDHEDLWAFIEIPKILDRIIALPGKDSKNYIFIEDLIKERVAEFFPGYKVKNVSEFRVARNADLDIDEDDAEDLLIEIEKEVQKRKFGSVVRLEITKDMNKKARKNLVKWLSIDEEDIFESTGPLDLKAFMKFSGLEEFEDLRKPRWKPQPSADFYKKDDLFEVIREKDRLISHPFESFDTVVDFVRNAARDPNVLAIKQTLYRVSGDSPIIDALIEAANNGKQVTALVELKARFDEENNIEWAKTLEKAGVHVIYGLPGLKIHGKAILVVREEDGEIRRYVHMATGNYNDDTASLYTDIGLFTANESIATDISMLFNKLSGYSQFDMWHKISVAPDGLRNTFYELIDREIENVKKGEEGYIFAKMNALIDDGIINKLYEASQAGVKINLVVRGMCSLVPGIKGVSDNIEVHSIVGEFLEHSRIYYFYNGGQEEYYLSSADWMQRNLNRRIEILFPVEEDSTRDKLKSIIDTVWNDTIKTRFIDSKGNYRRIDKRGKVLLNSQDQFCLEATQNYKTAQSKYLEELSQRQPAEY